MTREEQCWEPEIEMAPPERLRQIQEQRLKASLKVAYEKTAFYRRKFDEAGLKPGDITTLADVPKLPLTRYLEDFVATPLEDKLAVPWELVTEIMSTSGTLSGFTQPVAMTERDVERSFDLTARVLRMAGVRANDIVQLLMPWDVSIPTIKKLASKAISSMAGRMMLDHQLRLAKLMNTTVIFAMPSYLLRLVERAGELGIDLKNDTALRLAVLGGEPLATPVRKRLEAESGIECRDIYGFAEVLAIAGECSQRDGLHIWADHYLVEVIDPDTLEPLGPGEEGELVVTTLAKEAMPLIRYRTGDVTKLLDDRRCACGRTHPKIARVRGRVDHIVRVQGAILLPSDIEDLVVGMPGLGNEYRIVVDHEGELERLKIKVEHRPEVSNVEGLRREVEAVFEASTSLRCQVELVPQGTLAQTQFKAQRIVRAYQGAP